MNDLLIFVMNIYKGTTAVTPVRQVTDFSKVISTEINPWELSKG